MSVGDVVEQRRICWPDFDLTCLEGGCGYCNDHPFRNVSTVERAVGRGKVNPRHRGTGDKVFDVQEALQYGRDHNWTNAETRFLQPTR